LPKRKRTSGRLATISAVVVPATDLCSVAGHDSDRAMYPEPTARGAESRSVERSAVISVMREVRAD